MKANRHKHPERWYLAVVRRTCSCNDCGRALRRGEDCVYRYRSKAIVCPACADRQRICYPPSLRWEKLRTNTHRRSSSPRKSSGSRIAT
jgi:hypothetical protein